MRIVDLLETRSVPLSMLHRMMRSDGETSLTIDLPPSQQAIAAVERDIGPLPMDIKRWVEKYGSGATPGESGFVFGVSISKYKNLGLLHEGCLVVASFEEGYDLRYIDSEGGIASTSHGDWFPSYYSFVASVLCTGNQAVHDQFIDEVVALPHT